MACRVQAPSHCLKQSWPSSLKNVCITGPRWVNWTRIRSATWYQGHTRWSGAHTMITRVVMKSYNLLFTSPISLAHIWKIGQHYNDVMMSVITSQITSLMIVYSTVYSGADPTKHQSSASLVFVRGIHRGPVNSPHKWPVTRKMFPFDDVIMVCIIVCVSE